MSSQALPPVPYRAQITTPQGFLTGPWQGFFRSLVQIVLDASQIDASTAAAAAEAAEVSAAASAINAGTQAANSAASAAASAISATASAGSAISAANSALASATSATAAQAAVDAAAGSMSFAPDYITAAVTVPVHRQFIAFDRVTIASGGSLQILGRGRIL